MKTNKQNKNINNQTDLEKFTEIMSSFGVKIITSEDEYGCFEVRLNSAHHNSIPMYYFDEEGKFVEIITGVATFDECPVCSNKIYICRENK